MQKKISYKIGHITTVVLLVLSFIGLAQDNTVPSYNRYKTWYFGEYGGVDFGDLDGNGNPQTYTLFDYPGGVETYAGWKGTQYSESSAIISDENGDVLFYTNGLLVYDKDGTDITPGNTTLIPSVSKSDLGAPSSIGMFSGIDQNAYYSQAFSDGISATTVHIIPFRNNPNRYYIIGAYPEEYNGSSCDAQDGDANYPTCSGQGLRYAIVEIQNGNPVVIQPGTDLPYTTSILSGAGSTRIDDMVANGFSIRLFEGLSVVPHTTKKGYWLNSPVHGSGIVISRFVSDAGFDVDNTGNSVNPVINEVATVTNPNINKPIEQPFVINWDYFGLFANDGISIFKSNSTGTQLALTSYSKGSNRTPRVYVFNFNSETGEVTEDRLIEITDNGIAINDENIYPYGVEFSPNGEYLYYSSFDPVALRDYDGIGLLDPFVDNSSAGFNIGTDIGTGVFKSRLVSLNLSTNQSTSISIQSPGGLQIGSDGNIYMAHKMFHYLTVIENPNSGSLPTSPYQIALKRDLAPRISRNGLPSSIYLTSEVTSQLPAPQFTYNAECIPKADGSYGVEYIPMRPMLPHYEYEWDFGDGN